MKWRLQVYETLPSTSDVCIEAAEAGEPEGLAILARQQTNGRGTYGRHWVSPVGNLYLSVLLRPNEPVASTGLWSLLAAVALREAMGAGPIALKWPNDLMLGNAKLAGILLDSAGKGERLEWLVMGFGANLIKAPSVAGRNTASLAAGAVEDVANALLSRLEVWRSAGLAAARSAWLLAAQNLGNTIKISQPELEGRFHGIAADGALLLERPEGLLRVVSGEVLAAHTPDGQAMGHTGRRALLSLLLGATMADTVNAQETPPAPQWVPGTPPLIPLTTTPAPAASIRLPPTTQTIDKTKAYYVFFDQQVDVASMRALRRQLASLVEAGVSNITLVLDSVGGLVDPMLITYSFILALPAKINTHAQGFVQSAATILFLAGQERSADRNARFLFHPSQVMVTGVMGEPQIRERLMSFDAVTDAVDEILHDRTSLAKTEIERFARETVIYTAEQALAGGVVQTVADLRIPGDNRAKILMLD